MEGERSLYIRRNKQVMGSIHNPIPSPLFPMDTSYTYHDDHDTTHTTHFLQVLSNRIF